MTSIEWLRTFRIGDFAAFDFGLAFAGVLIISPLLRWLMRYLGLLVPLSSWLWFTIPVGEGVHLILKIETPLATMISDTTGHWEVKLLMIAMLTMGLKDVRKVLH